MGHEEMMVNSEPGKILSFCSTFSCVVAWIERNLDSAEHPHLKVALKEIPIKCPEKALIYFFRIRILIKL